VKARLVLSAATVAAALALAGCGGDSGTSANDPASLAPPDAPLYIQVLLRPQGQLKSDVETLASTVSGFSDPVRELIDFLDRSMNERPTLNGKRLSFARDIDPWLGEQAGIFLESFSDEPPAAGIVQTTDVDAAQAFIDDGKQQGDEDRSYEGVDYLLDGDSDLAVGIVDDFLVVGSEKAFKDAVDVAADADSLADRSEFTDAVGNAPADSLADVYVDVGLAIEQSEEGIDDEALQTFKSIGIDPTDATAVASIVPSSDQVEIDVSSDLGDAEAPSGDVSELIGSLPGDAFAAFGASGFSEQLKEAIDELDSSGIPGELPPNRLKSTLKAMGFDLDRIADSLEDAAVFAQGSGEGNLGGALVFTTSSGAAAETVANIGVLLRNTGVPGVTAVTGEASGFSVRDSELGRQPLVIVAKGDRIAIGYGRAAALRGVSAGGGATLSDTPSFEDAVASLGDTPLSAFVDGPGVLRLIDGLGAGSDPDFRSAEPYLRKADFLAAGTGSEDGLTTAKLIVGLK
jgi:hypothetical protein